MNTAHLLSLFVSALLLAGYAGAAGQDQSTSDAQASLWSTSAVLELYKLSGWRVIELRRIWANKDWPNDDPLTRHNAFTDLARFKNRWYCVFRVGADHGVTGPRGGLRVIRSDDGKNWTSVFFYQPKEKSVDVRDSKLLVTGDGRIVLLGHESYRAEPARTMFKQFGVRRSHTWISSDGEKWSGPHYCKEGENTWIWGGAWHKGAGYGVAYSEKDATGAIYRTADGKQWELLARGIFPVDLQGKHQGNEASIFFDPDDSAWIYLRDAAYAGGRISNIGFSRPPYTKWEWSRQTHVNLCGPKMIRMSDRRIVAVGRIWGRDGGAGYGDSHTALFELDLEDNVLHKIACLPSQGDTSYPGIVEKDGELWISYYSSHEDPNPEGRRAHLQRSCIYVARVKIGGPRYRYLPSDTHALVPRPSTQKLPAKEPSKHAPK